MEIQLCKYIFYTRNHHEVVICAFDSFSDAGILSVRCGLDSNTKNRRCHQSLLST